MNKKRRVMFAGLALVILLPIWFIVRFIVTPNVSPKAFQGRLDLTAWDFSKEGGVPLNGEWEFLSGTAVNPGELWTRNTE